MNRVYHFFIPGKIDNKTGGTIYDVRIAKGLSKLGRKIRFHELDGKFPIVDTIACQSAKNAIEKSIDRDVLIIDWFCILAFETVLQDYKNSNILIALTHNPISIDQFIEDEDYRSIDFSEREIKLFDNFDRIIVPSYFIAQMVNTIGLSVQTSIVNPGIDAVPYKRKVKKKGRIEILYVGSVMPHKGLKILVQALAKIIELNWFLTIVGNTNINPPYFSEIEKIIEKNKFQNKVKFVGTLAYDILIPFYQNSDIFVLPSYFESYGMVLAEAIGYSLPIIATNTSAIPDTVHSNSAILISKGDIVGLSETLKKFITDENFRSEKTRLAIQGSQKSRVWIEAIEQFDQVLTKTIESIILLGE